MKKSIKTIAIVIAIAMALMAVPSFAAETDYFDATVVVSNTGTTKAPVFIDGEVTYFCLQRDVKAPGADGVEYTLVDGTEYSDIIEKINSVLVNYYYYGISNETIAGFAVWAVIEDEVDNYRTLTKLRYGEEGAAAFDALLVQPEGSFTLNFAIYVAEGYQTMVTASVEEEMVMMPPPETTETTTEAPTEPPVETTTEPETVVETPTEEPSTEAPTEAPTEEPSTEETTVEVVETTTEEVVEITTEEVVETTTEEIVVVGNEEEPKNPSSIVSVPNTGVRQEPTTAIVLLVISTTILVGCGIESLYKRKKFSLV